MRVVYIIFIRHKRAKTFKEILLVEDDFEKAKNYKDKFNETRPDFCRAEIKEYRIGGNVNEIFSDI